MYSYSYCIHPFARECLSSYQWKRNCSHNALTVSRPTFRGPKPSPAPSNLGLQCTCLVENSGWVKVNIVSPKRFLSFSPCPPPYIVYLLYVLQACLFLSSCWRRWSALILVEQSTKLPQSRSSRIVLRIGSGAPEMASLPNHPFHLVWKNRGVILALKSVCFLASMSSLRVDNPLACLRLRRLWEP